MRLDPRPKSFLLRLCAISVLSVGALLSTGCDTQSPSEASTPPLTPTPSLLQVLVQPDGAVSGRSLAVQPVVAILSQDRAILEDGTGSTMAVTVSSVGASGEVQSLATVRAERGIARFHNLRLDGAESRVLRFVAGDLTADSNPVAVTQREAALALVSEPDGGTSGEVFPVQPLVEVLDDAGLRVEGSSITVSAELSAGSGFLQGVVEVAAVNGTVEFADLRVRGSGPHRLVFTSADLQVSSSSPFTIEPAEEFSLLAAGGHMSCGAVSSDDIYCWGMGFEGELPDPGAAASAPVMVGNIPGISSLSVGRYHACGLDTDGQAWCWGYNRNGQLGTGTNASSNTPLAVATELRFSSISAREQHTCGVALDGPSVCWGHNFNGQLGDGSRVSRLTPHPVSGEIRFSRIESGTEHTCALSDLGAAYCWGHSGRGQVGDDRGGGRRLEPVRVATEERFTSLAAGSLHTCALTADGAGYCWGSNGSGEVGDGTATLRTTPVRVWTDEELVAIVAGSSHSCALTAAGSVLCWGGAYYGQLGYGGHQNRPIPIAVEHNTPLTSVTAGADHTCGIAEDGVTLCWGRNGNGELGTGTTEGSPRPMPVLLP